MKDKHNTASLFTGCSTSKWCQSVSVRSCGRLLWGPDATADRDACCSPSSCCGTVDTAAVALSNWPQDWRVLRNCATVRQSPARGTGHLNLEENSNDGLKVKVWGKLLDVISGVKYRNDSPVLYQRTCSPLGGTAELERGSTRRAMPPHFSQCSASGHRDVVGSLTRF